MSNHVELSDDERKEVATFWGDYFRASGEGRQPTAFQLDAINDKDVRDAFLFWQLGADPAAYNPGLARPEVLALMEVFGDNPTGEQAGRTLVRLISDNTARGVEVEDIDTGSVWTLAHIMWLHLGGAWHWALDETLMLAQLVKAYEEGVPDANYPHTSPLSGIGVATAKLAFYVAASNDEVGMSLSAAMYGLDDTSPNTQWARSNYAQIRAERHNHAKAA